MPSAGRLVLVHGFTQSGRSWALVLPALEAAGIGRADVEVVTPDVPDGTGLTDVAATLAAQCGPAAWLGYSMGGRIGLHVALARPDVVERLVLVGATAGIDDSIDRATRRESDEGWAALVERVGVRAFLDKWLAQPMFAGLPPDAAGMEARLENTTARLAHQLRTLGTGSQQPLWDRLDELKMPVLVIAGERDAKFTALGHRLVAAIVENATMLLVEGAGHACHLENPHAFAAAVAPFLRP
jgi:2-succinyl-6-hydroxy-2,4-cyclohexadiene-1-carboxylate synthase